MITEIIDYVNKNSNISIVSFDIFDTLLFRTVSRPDEVFSRMYQWKSEMFPNFTDSDDWKHARKIAEGKAKTKAHSETGSREVKLDKIYEELPTVYDNPQELMALEIDTEKDTCFLNEEIYATLYYLKNELGMKIILVSDMYLTKKIILSILEDNGADIDIFDEVFVSCDYRASKTEGLLFNKVIDHYNISPNNILHVGDNYYGDYGTPRKLGLNVFAYNLISNAQIIYPFLFAENMAYDSICKEIYPLRLIAANHGKYSNKEEKLFFDIGAMILGPILTYATEWVIDEAEKRNISIIRPLMREGMFLSELLINSAKERKSEISISPLYISRLAAFTGMFHKININDISYILGVAHLSVDTIFKILNIPELEGPFTDFAEICSENFRNIECGENNLYEELYNYLSQESIINQIRHNNKDNSIKLYDYLCQEGLNQHSITLDIGWQGNIQNIISRIIMENEGMSPNLHLLVFSGPNVVKNVINGCDIRGFVGNFGKNQKDIAALSVKLLESFFLCLEGTTVAYDRVGEKIIPKTQQIEYSQWQTEVMKIAQKGIISFQKEYFNLVKKKPYIKDVKESAEELCKIVGRLFMFPQKNEADSLAKIQFDQNYGANCFVPVMKDSFLARYREKGKEFFYSTFRSNEEEWYSGINVYLNPYHSYDLLLQVNAKYTQYSLFLLVKRACEAVGDEKLVVMGAGGNARSILKYLSVIDKLSIVEGIVDNNPKLQGSSLAGIAIQPVSYQYNTNNYLCSVLNRAVCSSFYQQLIKSKENTVNYFSYFEEN